MTLTLSKLLGVISSSAILTSNVSSRNDTNRKIVRESMTPFSRRESLSARADTFLLCPKLSMMNFWIWSFTLRSVMFSSLSADALAIRSNEFANLAANRLRPRPEPDRHDQLCRSRFWVDSRKTQKTRGPYTGGCEWNNIAAAPLFSPSLGDALRQSP